jgi:hypothetical protein
MSDDLMARAERYRTARMVYEANLARNVAGLDEVESKAAFSEYVRSLREINEARDSLYALTGSPPDFYALDALLSVGPKAARESVA